VDLANRPPEPVASNRQFYSATGLPAPFAGPVERVAHLFGQVAGMGISRGNPDRALSESLTIRSKLAVRVYPRSLGICPSHAHLPVADSDSIHVLQHGPTRRARSYPLVNQQNIERTEHQTSRYHFVEVAVILMCLHNSTLGMVHHALQGMRDFMASIPGKTPSSGDTKHLSGNGKQRTSPLRIMVHGSGPERSSAPAAERRELRLRKLGC
jgi:hypothetical protein